MISDLRSMTGVSEAAERARIMALPAAHFQPLLDLLPVLRAPLPPVTPPLTEEADSSYTYAPINVPSVSATDGGRTWSNASAGNSQWLGVHLLANGTGWLGGGVGANRSTTDFFATSSNHPGPNVAIR